MSTLYYDGRCPLCSKEIALLRKLQWGNLAFEDVHSLTEYTEETRQKMLQVLHLRDDMGVWHRGVDATVMAWSYTPYGWLFKCLRWPLVGRLVDFVYNIWAKRRYTKLYDCQACGAIER